MPTATPGTGDEVTSWLVVVSGWTGAGKTTLAEQLADELDATLASFDWVMSALRSRSEVWDHVEQPPERQRRVGWDLLSRIAGQQLRRGSSCVLDLVAREEPRREWASLAGRYGAEFGVIECVCADERLHRSRIEGRRRDIPGWYELTWEQVRLGRSRYVPLEDPKLQLDAAETVKANTDAALGWLRDPDARTRAAGHQYGRPDGHRSDRAMAQRPRAHP